MIRRKKGRIAILSSLAGEDVDALQKQNPAYYTSSTSPENIDAELTMLLTITALQTATVMGFGG